MTAPYFFYKKATLYPEVFQAQLMQKFVQGRFLERGEVVSPFIRALVISFDQEGGLLENPDGSGVCRSRIPGESDYRDIHSRKGPNNPPRSLRARIVSTHLDLNTRPEDLRVYWPMFPSTGPDPVAMDFVYVFFENNDRRHGLWVSKVPGPNGEMTNSAPGEKPMVDAAKDGTDGKRTLASLYGDQPSPQNDYTDQQSLVGSDSDGVSKADMEYA
jgi:hypothetical protein